MRIIALTVMGIATVGIAGCDRGVSTNNGTLSVNGAAIGESIENGFEDAGNALGRAGPAIENGLDSAGNTLESGWNEVKETAREVTGEGNSSANTTGR